MEALPPNQHLAAPGKWPVVGEKTPRGADGPWIVSVTGLVRSPGSWSIEDLHAMPQEDLLTDIHCVTRWSRLGVRFRGTPLTALLERCRPLPGARYVSFVARSERGHSTSLTLADALALGTFIALEHEGTPLEEIHGGPVRTVVPGRYFYKSLKWLERIELLADDRVGHWEAEAGYHNRADPWLEERYMAPSLNRLLAQELIARRDFRGHDLRSLAAAGRDLDGVDARGALLRDADFRGASLAYARFDSANLSNAHLENANLRGASFVDADIEGADFRGADLRGADLRGASMLGATFTPDLAGYAPEEGAMLDSTTRLDRDRTEQLAPCQRDYVLRMLAG